MKKEIKLITAEETYDLRHEVLRPHQPIFESHYLGDLDPRALHAGVYIDGVLVSVATIHPEAHETFETSPEHTYRLRGMATSSRARSQGLGSELLGWMIQELKKRDARAFIWCNARVKAREFYERLGFKTEGDVFDITGIGSHYVMWSALK